MGEAIKTFIELSGKAEILYLQYYRMRRTLFEIEETIKSSEGALRWWRPPPARSVLTQQNLPQEGLPKPHQQQLDPLSAAMNAGLLTSKRLSKA